MNYLLTRVGPGMEDQQIAVTLDYEREPVIPAIGRSWDDPGEPASGGEITKLVAYDEDGKDVALTAKEYDAACEFIYDREEW